MAGPGMETPNELMVVFSDTVSAGFDALQGAVTGVFGLMIALVVALTGIQWALSSNRDILAAAFGKILLIGAFAWLINDWQSLSETIYAGFIELGLLAGGGSMSRADFLNPGAVLAQGWEIVKALGETPAPVNNPLDIAGNLTDALILGLAMIGIMLAFAVLALQIIVSLLEFKIVTLGGFVLLPFGIWSKSAFLAERPLGYVVSAGLKVLAIAIVVSGARTIFDQLQPTANPDIYEALAILVAAILLAMLALFIPNLAAALVTGGPALGAGTAVGGSLAVGGAGLLAAGGVSSLGASAGGRSAATAGSSRASAWSGLSARRPGPSGPPSPPAPPPVRPPPSGPAPTTPASTFPATRSSTSGPPESSAGLHDPSLVRADDGAAPMTMRPRPSEPDGSTSPPIVTSIQAASVPGASDTPPREVVRALRGGSPLATSASPGRSAALRAYLAANQGRALLPASETTGTLSPSLKTEEP